MTQLLLEGLTSSLLAAGDAASRVGSGRIVGGWEFVWASYAIAWGGIACYGLSLWVRHAGAMSKSKELP